MPFLSDTSPLNKRPGKRLLGNVNTLRHALVLIPDADFQSENPIVGTKTPNVEKCLLNGGFENVGQNCPPPKKIHKGVSVFRDFPPLCGRQKNYVSSSSSYESREEMRKTEGKLIEKNRVGEMKSNFNSQTITNNDEYLLDAKGSNEPRFNDYKAIISRNKVREALKLFEATYKKFLKKYEAKQDKQGKLAWTLLVEAAAELKQQDKWVNTEEHFVGAVPGIEIGDCFNFRVELVIIGLHRKYYLGIDYVDIHGNCYATSIVDSGRYIKEVEYSDVLIYSGQGGNPAIACKKLEDQKLERGNLALKNSMDAKSPVRVIRSYRTLKGGSSPKSPSSEKKTYIYDGLYIVSKCSQERGKYGKLVFIFHLERIKGQPKTTQFEPAPVQPRKYIKSHENCVVNDISQGKEKCTIRVINSIDDEKPRIFNYIMDMIYPELNNFSMPRSCDCVDDCSESEQCSCMVKNGGELPFDCNGAIIKAKSIIYECGPLCKCSSSCKNRVSQCGIQYKLEVFKKGSRGWGVRSQSFISAGSFICEYVGEVVRDNEANGWVGKDEYSIGIGTHNHDFQDGDYRFIIDTVHFGNVGRFIKRSCEPNLYVQNVLYDHEDKRMPHVMLFSSKNIPPLQELICNLNYAEDRVRNGIAK